MTDDTPGRDLELARDTTPVTRADTDSWANVIGQTAKLADYIAGTEFVPRALQGKPAAVAAAILYGREVGLPPMTALTQTHVIEGKPSTSAEGMRALVIAAGHELTVVEATGSQVTMRARRRGSEMSTDLTWTIDMARAAGLANKDVWKKYPRAMLAARCTDELCGLVFPDVVHGLSVVDPRERDEEPPPAPTTAVSRDNAPERKPRKRAPRKPPEPVSRDDGGLPLPGEDGYTDAPEKPAEQPEAPLEPEARGESDTPAEATETENGSQPAPDSPPDEPPAEDRKAPARPSSRAQHRMILAALGKLGEASGLEDGIVRDERLSLTSRIVKRDVDSFANLTSSEASTMIDTLALVPSLEALYEVLDKQESETP